MSATIDWKALRTKASDVASHAYAPYSRFPVGAAALVDGGRVVVGCNVESGAFPLTTCAERMAVGAAVVAGHRRFVRLALSTDGDAPIPPCGGCRQVLAELGLDVTVVSEAGGKQAEWRLADLLPEPFVFRGSGRKRE